MKKNRIIVIAIMLILSIGNYTRLKGTESIRLIEFLSIFAIGALAGLLINDFITLLRSKPKS